MHFFIMLKKKKKRKDKAQFLSAGTENQTHNTQDFIFNFSQMQRLSGGQLHDESSLLYLSVLHRCQ